jgi:drug/metabolite transporter (DMT)-like permease
MPISKNTLKGSFLIAAAACCYGVLGTFVKMAYSAGFTTAEITLSQFSLGFLSLLILNCISRHKTLKGHPQKTGKKSTIRMIIAGTSLGFTSICYYMAVRYIAVSIGIILLLQAVWMSIVLEGLVHKKRPALFNIIAVIVIIGGTVLATGVLQRGNPINWPGVVWGLLSAVCYTATMYSSNHVEQGLPALKRSFLIVTGGFLLVLVIFFPELMHGISFKIFLSWGLLVSLFGTILPPILFAKGMPLTGMGLGAILTSLEVPVSILSARYWLGESVSTLQWSGVMLILTAIIMVNIRGRKESKM